MNIKHMEICSKCQICSYITLLSSGLRPQKIAVILKICCDGGYELILFYGFFYILTLLPPARPPPPEKKGVQSFSLCCYLNEKGFVSDAWIL